METLNIILPIITAFIGGGATWLFTIKYDRKQAEATAMEKLQVVYQRMIADLNADRERLEKEISQMKDKIAQLEKKFNEKERIMRIARNHCCVKAEYCPNFESFDFSKL